jgi:predicted RNase H-like nuclease (RuvC/YqgF family)
MNRLRQDRSDLTEQVNQLNYILTKVKNELAEKDNMIGRSVSNNDSELKLLRQQLESKKQEINQLQSSLRETRMALKDL